jgi:hypothetical protein
MKKEDLENRFAFHPPADLNVKQKHDAVRNWCLRLSIDINDLIPEDSREKSLAVTSLEEVMFWANAAIARNPVTRME